MFQSIKHVVPYLIVLSCVVVRADDGLKLVPSTTERGEISHDSKAAARELKELAPRRGRCNELVENAGRPESEVTKTSERMVTPHSSTSHFRFIHPLRNPKPESPLEGLCRNYRELGVQICEGVGFGNGRLGGRILFLLLILFGGYFGSRKR